MMLEHLDRKFAVDDHMRADVPGKIISVNKRGTVARVCWIDGMQSSERLEEWRWNGKAWK
jgi:hypothetical protein